MVAPDDNLVHMHKYKYKYINTNVYTYRYIQTCSDSDMVSSNNNQVQGVSKKTLFKRLAPKKVVSRAAS